MAGIAAAWIASSAGTISGIGSGAISLSMPSPGAGPPQAVRPSADTAVRVFQSDLVIEPSSVASFFEVGDQVLHLGDLALLGGDDLVRQLAYAGVGDLRPLAGHDRNRVVRDHRPHVLGVVDRRLAADEP